jgi:Flp pilus assembly pilin Flp
MVSIIALLLVVGVVALFNAVQERFGDNADCAEQAYDGVGC